MNMQKWKNEIINNPVKKAMPFLLLPCIQKTGINVNQLLSDSTLLAKGMKIISDNTDILVSLGLMDLSVEAELFGSQIHTSHDEVPTVTGRIIHTKEDAHNLKVPAAAQGRALLYINAIRQAVSTIHKPVFAGAIGPFSLAGRLMDMSEIMINCYDEPQMVHETLERTTEFIIDYILEFKKAGANGIFICEPAAGLLSPDLNEEFSSLYIKKIIKAVKDENFFFMYHNCGPNIQVLLPVLAELDADAYHFGDVVNMKKILEGMPADVIVSGNISPSKQFCSGTKDSMYAAVTELLNECSVHDNFILSSGCDVPPMTPWANIDSFFKAASDFYKVKMPEQELPHKHREYRRKFHSSRKTVQQCR